MIHPSSLFNAAPAANRSSIEAQEARSARSTAHAPAVYLILLLAIAAALRLFMLGHQSLWLDEIASWEFASQHLHRVLQSEPTNPPIYYLILHFWMKLFGTTETGIRSLNIVPSVFCVWLAYRFSDRLFDRGVAYVSAAYMTFSTFQIYYAQEARCFALLTVLLLAATMCLWEALNSESARQGYLYYGAYTLLAALALYTHFITIFFLAAHGLYVLFRRTKHLWNVTASIAGALLLFSPWLITMLRVAGHGGQIRRYLPLKLPQAYFSFLYGYSLIPMDDQAVRHVVQTLAGNWWILAMAILSLSLLLAFWRLAWKRWPEPMLFVFVMGTVPVLMAFLVSFKIMLFSDRYLIAASPFIYMSVAAAIAEFWCASQTAPTRQLAVYRGWAACGLFCVLLVLSLRNYYFNPRFSKEQWRQADAYIDASVHVGEKAIIIFDPDYLVGCYRYYSTRDLESWRVTPQIEAKLATSDELLREHTQGYQQIFLVRSHDESDTVVTAMRKAFSLEHYQKFSRANPIEVYSFRGSTP